MLEQQLPEVALSIPAAVGALARKGDVPAGGAEPPARRSTRLEARDRQLARASPPRAPAIRGRIRSLAVARVALGRAAADTDGGWLKWDRRRAAAIRSLRTVEPRAGPQGWLEERASAVKRAALGATAGKGRIRHRGGLRRG